MRWATASSWTTRVASVGPGAATARSRTVCTRFVRGGTASVAPMWAKARERWSRSPSARTAPWPYGTVAWIGRAGSTGTMFHSSPAVS